MTAPAQLLEADRFISAAGIDDLVPAEYGLYALRLRVGVELPAPFDLALMAQPHRLIYLGEARTQTLRRRPLANELRARGNGTFFRSIGAVLGYRPPFGSLAGKARVQNYRFSPTDRDAIVARLNENIEVSWIEIPQSEIHAAEVALISAHAPLLNLRDNPRVLDELSALRGKCRRIAAGVEA